MALTGWKTLPLGDFLELITYGFTNPMPTTVAGPYMVTAKDIRGGKIDYQSARHTSPEAFSSKLTNKSRPNVGDILLTKDGSIGRVAVCDRNDVCINQSVALLRPNSKILPAFLSYLLQAPKYQNLMENDSAGSTIKHIYITRVDKMPISVPEPAEQRAIAEVLGALDDKIAANTKLAETAETLMESHYKKAVSSNEATSRPLFDVIDIDFGEAFKGEHFSEPGKGRPLIRIRDLKTFTSQVWTHERRGKEVLVQPGDVVIGMDAEFRPTAWLGEPGLLNQRVCRARGKSSGPAFVRESLKEPLSLIEGYKTATTVIHLNKKDLEETSVLVPGKEALARFENAVEALYSQRVSLAAENRTLAATRDALLPQLMSGKLRVKDIENTMGEMV